MPYGQLWRIHLGAAREMRTEQTTERANGKNWTRPDAQTHNCMQLWSHRLRLVTSQCSQETNVTERMWLSKSLNFLSTQFQQTTRQNQQYANPFRQQSMPCRLTVPTFCTYQWAGESMQTFDGQDDRRENVRMRYLLLWPLLRCRYCKIPQSNTNQSRILLNIRAAELLFIYNGIQIM